MSCVFRVSGRKLDVEQYKASSKLEIVGSYVKGQPRYPKTQPNGLKNKSSGFNISVSKKSFNDLRKQVRESIEFIQNNKIELRKIMKLPGVESGTLDFGIDYRNVYAQFDYFPPELLILLGHLGIGLELSNYHIDGKFLKKKDDIISRVLRKSV